MRAWRIASVALKQLEARGNYRMTPTQAEWSTNAENEIEGDNYKDEIFCDAGCATGVVAGGEDRRDECCVVCRGCHASACVCA